MSFTEYLTHEFDRRKRSNPRYSTRAYARDLEIEPSLLWKFLKGRRKLTPEMTARLGAKLKVPPLKVEEFVAETSADIRRDKIPHALTDLVARELNWRHYLMLEALRIPSGGAKSVDELSEMTGIEIEEARAVLSDIVQRGLAREREDGSWETIEGNVVIDSTRKPNAKDDYAWMFQRALSALSDPPDIRTVGAITVSADAERVLAAKEMIRKFAGELVEFLNASPKPPDGIYEFCFHLFPLAKARKPDER